MLLLFFLTSGIGLCACDCQPKFMDCNWVQCKLAHSKMNLLSDAIGSCCHCYMEENCYRSLEAIPFRPLPSRQTGRTTFQLIRTCQQQLMHSAEIFYPM